MKALVFAAGLGTRLKPFTLHAPKALYPLCSRPLLYWTVLKLKRSGLIDGITVNVHHFATMIEEYLASEDFLSMSQGLDVSVSDESGCLLETGGGMLFAEKHLSGGPFMMHNSDIVSNADLPALAAAHDCGCMATLLVSERESSRYLLFDSGKYLCGWYNASTGEVRSPLGKIDPRDFRMLAFSGIHTASPGIFDCARDLGFSGKFSIVDLYVSACASYRIKAFVQENLVLADAGRPDNMRKAEQIVEKYYNFVEE